MHILLQSYFQSFLDGKWQSDLIRLFESSGWISLIFEFSLNDFHWIQWICWIMTKSKNSMVTRNNTQLVTYTLPVAVIKIIFPPPVMVRYLLSFTPVNCYLTRCSWEHLIFATTSGNISVISCVVSLVTILLLDVLIFHGHQERYSLQLSQLDYIADLHPE